MRGAKIDGAGISAVYENGKLVRLLTRGDGTKGDDITRNAFVLRNLPIRLTGTNVPSLLEIRGEAYMTRAEFDRLSAAAISKTRKPRTQFQTTAENLLTPTLAISRREH